MFELSGVNYEEVLEQGDSILVRVIASSSYRGFELSGLYCIRISLEFLFGCITMGETHSVGPYTVPIMSSFSSLSSSFSTFSRIGIGTLQ